MIRNLTLILFMVFLFFLPIDIGRLLGDQYSIIQTLLKGSITLSIIALYLLNIYFNHKIINYSNLSLNKKLFLLPWLYFFLALLSIMWSDSQEATIKSLIGLVSVILLADLLTKKYELTYILQKSLLVLDVIIILSLISLFLNLPFSIMEFVDANRYAGITYGAHAIGRVAFIAFLIRIYFLSQNQPKFKFLFFNIFMLLIYFYSIQIADSRQILIALIVILPLWLSGLNKYLFKEYKNHIYVILFFIFILVLLLFFNYYADSILNIFQRTGKEDVLTFTGRIYVWESAFKLIDIKPFLGYGYGAGGDTLYEFHRLVSLWSTHSAHNIFIHQLLDLGFIGLFFLLLHIGHFIYLSIHFRSKLMISFFIFVLVVGFLERALSGPPSLMYLFFIIFYFYFKKYILLNHTK